MTSRRTSGWRATIFRSVSAAPDGWRRPCSHCCNVRGEILSAAANWRCDRPLFRRAATNSFASTLSGNVYRDLGKDNPDLKQFKAILAAEIIKALDREHLSVRKAHARTG